MKIYENIFVRKMFCIINITSVMLISICYEPKNKNLLSNKKLINNCPDNKK